MQHIVSKICKNFGRTHIQAFSWELLVNAAGTELGFNSYTSQQVKKMTSYGAQSDEDIDYYALRHDAIIVDLRSDTVTKPSEAMRLAMSQARVGDDVYGEDLTVNALEMEAAEKLGKEAALFVPSGTMGNLIAIMVHCNERGCEAYCGEDSHTILHEQGGAAQLAGVTLCPIANASDGSFDLDTLRRKLRSDRLHEPTSRLVMVENPFNGRIVNQQWIKSLSEFAKESKLKLHMDGARLWNAVVASGKPVKEIVEPFDSITFCLSKGLGAPVGSLLCGSRTFIDQARRIRKVLGGGMRQVGVLAAAGIIGLKETVPILYRDHERAKRLAAALCEFTEEINHRGLKIDALSTVETNMVFLTIFRRANNFVNDLCLITESDDPKVLVQAFAINEDLVRFVLHRDITDQMLDAAIKKIIYVLEHTDLYNC